MTTETPETTAPTVCDWCRAPDPEGDAEVSAHRETCREYLAWVIHPEEDVLRDYWVVVGDFHKLHITRVLGAMRRVPTGREVSKPYWQAARWANHGPGDVTISIAKRARTATRDSSLVFEAQGVINDPEGWVYNTLEGARAKALRMVRHYEETAAKARRNVEGPPTVRRYPKKLAARRLTPDPTGANGACSVRGPVDYTDH